MAAASILVAVPSRLAAKSASMIESPATCSARGGCAAAKVESVEPACSPAQVPEAKLPTLYAASPAPIAFVGPDAAASAKDALEVAREAAAAIRRRSMTPAGHALTLSSSTMRFTPSNFVIDAIERSEERTCARPRAR